jgi:myosin heavy subunit
LLPTQHSTAQHNTTQHNTTQHITAPHNSTQHNIPSHSFSTKGGERNYHSFLQLCAAAQSDARHDQNWLTSKQPEWQMRPAQQHKILSMSNCYDVPGIDDGQDFDEVCKSMMDLRFTEGEMQTIWGIVAGILHMGDVNFQKDDEGSKVQAGASETGLKKSAELLGADFAALQHALIIKEMELRGERMQIPLRMEQANGNRDALTKVQGTR